VSISVHATSQQRGPHSSAPRRLVALHPVAAFLAMVFSVNVAVALVPVLTRRDILPFDLALYESLGPIFGVALPAFLVVAATHGRDGVRDLASRCLRWRVGLRWHLFAFLSVPVAVLSCASAFFGRALLEVLAEKWDLLFTAVLPQLLFLILFFIVAEEIGFMGFLQARLQTRYGPLKASVIATLPFALYHLPGLMVETGLGFTRFHVVLAFLGILAVLQMFGRVVMMWLYNATGSSALLVGLWHSSFDATTSAFGRTFVVPGPDWTAELSGFWIPSAVVAVLAVLVVVFTRGRLSYRPDRAHRPTDAAPQRDAPLAHG
jgi:membrane protease YdiL (CAAX protease family)